MTPSEEKTAEERARVRAELDTRNRERLLRIEGEEIPEWPYIYCLEIERLRLTNQRLEAEVERMKEVLKSIEGQIVGGYLSGRGEQSALWRIRELSSRGEQK